VMLLCDGLAYMALEVSFLINVYVFAG